jgi:hypothetical protein
MVSKRLRHKHKANTQTKEIEANAQKMPENIFSYAQKPSRQPTNPFCLLPSSIPFPFGYLFTLSFQMCLEEKLGKCVNTGSNIST